MFLKSEAMDYAFNNQHNTFHMFNSAQSIMWNIITNYQWMSPASNRRGRTIWNSWHRVSSVSLTNREVLFWMNDTAINHLSFYSNFMDSNQTFDTQQHLKCDCLINKGDFNDCSKMANYYLYYWHYINTFLVTFCISFLCCQSLFWPFFFYNL